MYNSRVWRTVNIPLTYHIGTSVRDIGTISGPSWSNRGTTLSARHLRHVLCNLKRILEPFRDHLGIILESFWDHLGTIVGSSWDHLGNILGPSWDNVGIILGPPWDQIGTILKPLWDHIGITLGPSGEHVGTILGPLWYQKHMKTKHTMNNKTSEPSISRYQK